MEQLPLNIEPSSPDILASLPTELQHSVLFHLRKRGGIQSLFSPRSVSRRWCRLIDDHLYHYFAKGPEVLYCYVNLWNRFRQKLIQQRVTLRLRVRTTRYNPNIHEPASTELPGPPSETKKQPSSYPNVKQCEGRNIESWQPSSESSENPSLSPRDYTAYIYDACFDTKYSNEQDIVHPVDINPHTPYPISLGSGLTTLLERAGQPARSGTIFPLFHVIQEAWDFVLGEDAALLPVYPPIASEAWIQIRLATGAVAARYREPPAIPIEATRDPYWPFRFEEYSRSSGERSSSAGLHQFAVVSRLALPNLVRDEGVLLVTVREAEVGEWIQDPRYREIMQSMIAVADVGGPQEFILGGAVVQLEDYERFIPRGMTGWFRRRILGKRTRTASPESAYEMNSPREFEELPSSSDNIPENEGLPGNVMARLQRVMEILGAGRDDEPEPPPRTPGPPPPRFPRAR